jgi:uncharacterized glyoxalase superfamily protein PhnB
MKISIPLLAAFVLLLKISEAPGLIVPAKVADSSAGQRLMFTVRVASVDEVCGKLKTLGVQLLNGPQDRPWGRRTAAFADPAVHVWELAHGIMIQGVTL